VIGDILQPTHLLFILVIALIVLGPKRLPEVGKSLGRGLRDFRVALSGNEETQQLRDSLQEARQNLQETHETLHQPIVMQPAGAAREAAAAPEQPLAGAQVQAPATPVVQQDVAQASAPQPQPTPADAPTAVQEPVERPG
jgi:sec-independent protein translocase protein TatA